MIKLFKCPACGGDGKETCNNPDHGFLSAMDGIFLNANESACPCCGHNEDHKTGHPCPECNATGLVTEEQGERISDEWGIDNELEERIDLVKLHLVLIGTWFDMISQDIKKEEYRSFTDYWCRRLFDYMKATEDDLPYKKFGIIEFQHGYQPDARRMVVEFKGIELGKGKPEWGGSSEVVFIIKLGNILHRNF